MRNRKSLKGYNIFLNNHLSRLNNAQFDRARTLQRENKTIDIEIRKDPLLSGLDHCVVQRLQRACATEDVHCLLPVLVCLQLESYLVVSL